MKVKLDMPFSVPCATACGLYVNSDLCGVESVTEMLLVLTQ